MGAIASQITSLTSVYSAVQLGADQRKHENRRPVNSPHKGPVTRKMFPFDDVITVNITVVVITIIIYNWLEIELLQATVYG